MMGLAFAMVLQTAVISAGEQDYKSAYQQAAETGKPLVVLIGADWCPGCRTMKQSTMPQLASKGDLGKVCYAQVNTDRDHDLAGKLMTGGSIPQLVMFWKSASGWQRQQLTGAHSPSEIRSFLDQAQTLPPAALTSNAKDPSSTN